MRRKLNRLIARLLTRATNYFKIKPIYRDDGELYLERYYVATLFNYWRIYLHHFVGDDPDGVHCHPWLYGFSIILCGSYTEELRWGYRHVGCFSWVPCDKFHRVLIDGSDCWSLFIHSPKLTNWGFIRNKGVFKQFVEVGEDIPLRHGTWHLDAPTGREWRIEQEVKQVTKAYG